MHKTIGNEKEIVQRCLAGENDVFAQLVNRYESHVKALAWNIAGNPEDALEISQDVFFQAFRNLARFDLNRDFRKWVLGITVKRSIDHLRKRKTFLNFFSRYAEEVPMTMKEEKPFEESPLFSPLLRRLKERERIALSLQVNENYTAKEIGEVLNCSESSVRVMLFKAKKKLKKELLAQDVRI